MQFFSHTFQVLSSHVSLVDTISDSADIKHFHHLCVHAAMTKDHKLGGLKQQECILSQF